MDYIQLLLEYIWIIPAILASVGALMMTSPKDEYRRYGYSWLMWASTILLIICAAGYSEMWVAGAIGIIYSVYGYWRIYPNEPTAQQLEERYIQ